MEENKEPAAPRRLTEIVTAMLVKHNYPGAQTWQQGLHPDCHKTPDLNAQRFFINRYWNHQIGLFPGNNIEVRYCLVEGGPIEEWATLFETYVIPCLLKHSAMAA